MLEGDASGQNLDMFSDSVKMRGNLDYANSTPSHHR